MNFEVEILYPAQSEMAQWVPVGTEILEVEWESIPPTAATHLAEKVWERWNRGSGSESPTFLRARTRSMCVGDLVMIPALEVALVCDSFGWETVAVTAENICREPNTPTTIRPLWATNKSWATHEKEQ